MPAPKRAPISLGGARREPETDPLAGGMSPTPAALRDGRSAAADPASKTRAGRARKTPPAKTAKAPAKAARGPAAKVPAPRPGRRPSGGRSTASGPDHAAAAEAVAAAAVTRAEHKAKTTYWDEAIFDRVRAAAMFLNAYKPEAGVRSTRDILEPAAVSYIDYLERTYNGGEPFPGVRLGGLPTGRPRR